MTKTWVLKHRCARAGEKSGGGPHRLKSTCVLGLCPFVKDLEENFFVLSGWLHNPDPWDYKVEAPTFSKDINWGLLSACRERHVPWPWLPSSIFRISNGESRSSHVASLWPCLLILLPLLRTLVIGLNHLDNPGLSLLVLFLDPNHICQVPLSVEVDGFTGSGD